MKTKRIKNKNMQGRNLNLKEKLESVSNLKYMFELLKKIFLSLSCLFYYTMLSAGDVKDHLKGYQQVNSHTHDNVSTT